MLLQSLDRPGVERRYASSHLHFGASPYLLITSGLPTHHRRLLRSRVFAGDSVKEPDVYRFIHPECAGILSGDEPGRALDSSRRIAPVRF